MDDIFVIDPSSYPDTLKALKHPPKKLYARGRFPAPERQKYLCVVGARKWSPYGRDAVNRIISGLRGYPVSIVSGLAIGIDSIAHIAALEAGLHCVAFPGSSLDWDEIYPASHLGLAHRIIENGGAIVSQWKPGYPTGKWAFPARNVLMASISHATLIVEAGHRSGSLMTAQHAEGFGRDVYAIPGSIAAPLSYGPHMLIRNGAALINSAEDVLRELGIPISETISKQIKTPDLDPVSKSILDRISREDMTVDMLAEMIHAPIPALLEKITLLEMEGLARVDGGMVHIV